MLELFKLSQVGRHFLGPFELGEFLMELVHLFLSTDRLDLHLIIVEKKTLQLLFKIVRAVMIAI
jgi:hypothetical protein